MTIKTFKEKFLTLSLKDKSTAIREMTRLYKANTPSHLIPAMEDLISWCNAITYSPSIGGFNPEEYLNK